MTVRSFHLSGTRTIIYPSLQGVENGFWPDGIEALENGIWSRLQTFLKVPVEHEKTAMQRGRLGQDQRLLGPWDGAGQTVTFGSCTQRRRILRLIRSSGGNLISCFSALPRCLKNISGNRELDCWVRRQFIEQVVDWKLEQMQERALAWESVEVDTFKTCCHV